MALDWNKEISLSSLKGLFGKGAGAPGGSSYPTKATMNLYQGDAKTSSLRSVAMVGVLLAAGIALFVKFGVLDQLALVSQRQAELSQQRLLASSLSTSLDDYDTVKEAYDSFTARYGSGAADAIGVLNMVEQHVMPKAQVSSIVLSGGALTLTLYDVPLNTVGDLAKDLEGQDMVAGVNVSTATTQNAEGQNTISSLVVTLVGAEGERE